MLFLCTKQFNARLGDELTLKQGDTVQVLADDSEYNDGWYMGKNLRSGEVGLYPKLFTQVIKDEGLLRSRLRKQLSDERNGLVLENSTGLKLNNLANLGLKLSLGLNIGAATVKSSTDGSGADSGFNGKNSNLNGFEPSDLINDVTKSLNNVSLDIDNVITELNDLNNGTLNNEFNQSKDTEFNGNSLQFDNADKKKKSGGSGEYYDAQASIENEKSNFESIKPNGFGLSTNLSSRTNSSNLINTQNRTNSPNALNSQNISSNKPDTDTITNLISQLSINKYNRSDSFDKLASKDALALNKAESNENIKNTQYTPQEEVVKTGGIYTGKLSNSNSYNKRYENSHDSTPNYGSTINNFGTPRNMTPKGDSYFGANAPDSGYFSKDPNLGNPGAKSPQTYSSLLDPLPLNPKTALSWTSAQVSNYFRSLKFDNETADKFTIHQVDGSILFELDLAHLKELDIEKFGTRFQIYKEIENLKNIVNGDNKKDEKNDLIHNANRSYKGQNLSEFPASNEESSEYKKTLMPSASLFQKSHQRKLSSTDQSNFQKTHNRRTSSMDQSNSFQNHRRNNSSIDGGYQKFHQRKRSNSIGDMKLDRNYQFGDSDKQADIESRPSSSVYEASINSHNRQLSGSKTPTQLGYHTRQSSTNSQRRHSNILSFFGKDDDSKKNVSAPKVISPKLKSNNLDGATSPSKLKRHSGFFSPQKQPKSTLLDSPVNNSEPNLSSPKKSKSISYKDISNKEVDDKRIMSDTTTSTISRLKTLRTTSTQNFKNLTTSKKSKTSAFQEGIQEVLPDDAIKTANFSGWMSKRSGNTLSWRSRYFTLHGTRLSYFTSLKDKREKGLIDITAHKVVPVVTEEMAGNNDKFVALYASSTGFGRYCFKLVPPAPGFRKGLTFTQPKVHYFAVDDQEDMRGWMKALMTATIDIDDSVPVVSSCSTPTVSLAKAQELLAKAREETRLKDEELRLKGYIRDGYDEYSGDQQTSFMSNSSPAMESPDDTTVSSVVQSKPTLTIDSSRQNPSTPSLTQSQGFSSPYLLAGGLMSPKLGTTQSPKDNYFNDIVTPTTGSPIFSNNVGRVISGKKK